MKNFTTIILILFSIATQAQIIRVNNNVNVDADYTDLQSAVDAAMDGDTIYLEPSAIEYASATIVKPLVIIGGGYFLDENEGIKANTQPSLVNSLVIGDAGNPTNSDADGTVIIGLELGQFSSGSSVITSYDQVSIIRCAFNANILTLEDASSSGSLITQSIFEGGSSYINFENVSTSNTVSNCIISSEDSDIIFRANGNTFVNNTIVYNGPNTNSDLFDIRNGSFTNNLIWLGDEKGNVVNGTGNSFTNNLILNSTDHNLTDYVIGSGSTDGQWQLADGSPAEGAGENGVDVGAFGGLTPYILSGVPPIPRISSISVPTTGSSSTGLQVQVTITSQN